MHRSAPSVLASEYEEAVKSLNTLQSNPAYINAAKQRNALHPNVSLEETRKYLIRSGLSQEQLDGLSVIHVAGTKGKGSTCAFVEAILREHGYRTGFYSSPHLVSVRERIRLDGRPLGEPEFSRHFRRVYGQLDRLKDHERDMPQYFKFLTILMFHVFVEAKVDVAILEVGIGGEYDCTNVVSNTVCAGITSLGLDHTSLLGDTLEAIAWQKSGILKPGAAGFTVAQPSEAMRVLERQARERNCQLSLVPSLASYPWKAHNCVPVLGIPCSVQRENASLAIKLASAWLSRQARNDRRSAVLESTENKPDDKAQRRTSLCYERTALALKSCRWPGRTQLLPGRKLDFYIDGAHTDESIDCCVAWFGSMVKHTRPRRRKYLIFNVTGDRDPARLLARLKELSFDQAYFVPNVAGVVASADQENYNIPVSKQLDKCRRHAVIWGESSVLAGSVYEALKLITQEAEVANQPSQKCHKPQVLVTGSLHLVGALLSILDPDLTMTTNF